MNTPTTSNPDLEKCARAICRSQLAQSGQFGPRGLDKQVDKYWRDWVPEVHACLSALLPPSPEMGNEGGREAERAAIVAWLRDQQGIAVARAIDAESGSTSERNFMAGAVAIKRSADAIERADHISKGS